MTPLHKRNKNSPTYVIDTMLDYFQIEQGGSKDETLSKRNLKKFLDSLTENYERQIIEDTVRKIKDKLDEMSTDDMNGENFDEFNDEFGDYPDQFSKNSDKNNKNKNQRDFNPDIEEFLAWLSAVLYSADHKIEISTTGNKMNIVVTKLDNGRRK